MYKPLFLAAVLLAQGAMPGVRLPQTADGITVTGTAFASASATQADMTLRVSSRNNAMNLNAQTLQPVIDALVRSGVHRSDISLPSYFVGQARANTAAVTAHVQHPTAAMLQQGMLTMANAFASLPDILLNSAEVRLSVDNCAQLQRDAEARALANARQNAEFVAQQIGAKLGSVAEVTVSGSPGYGPQPCTQGFALGPFGSSAGQSSPADMLTVKVYSSVTMRFAIRK